MGAATKRPIPNRVMESLVWFHRWLGIATCVVFALWFASGAVLLFKPFPSLPRAAQLKLEAPVALDAVQVSPGQAAISAGGKLDALRLVQRGPAPAYIASTAAGAIAIDAQSGNRLDPLALPIANRMARTLIGSTATVQPAVDYDQWVVHNRFDSLRPFFRVDAGDAAGTRYYVSARTGEIVQRTDTADRAWNWVGAVLHWAYFTPLRSNYTVWDQTVWWLSFVALLVAIAGTVLGVIRMMAAQRQRQPALTFFRPKWMRWHHLLGLFASVFVVIWTLSGWLSMDHGRLFSRGQASPEQLARYAGQPLSTAAAKVDLPSLKHLAGAREIQFSAIGGGVLITAWDAAGQPHHQNATGSALTKDAVVRLVTQGVAAAWPAGAVAPPTTPAETNLYALAEGWPSDALLFVDPKNVRPDIVIDGASGHPLTVLNGSRKAYAWIYYGLHTFKFPGLAEHRSARQIVVLIPLLLGFIFSITGVVIGYQRLRKSI